MLENLIETVGDAGAGALMGLTVGLLFGICAERSGFCLRSAAVGFWRGEIGERFAVWLLVFGTALVLTQVMLMTGHLPRGEIRQLTTPGTLSGAIIGGTLFGAGMILARGCASRLLVLSGTGNLRALVAGLVLTVVAQASLRGVLAPSRTTLSQLWVLPGEQRDLGAMLPAGSAIVAGLFCALLALAVAQSSRARIWQLVFACGAGLAVALGWWLTATLAATSFEAITIQSVSFTGPSADTLMALVNTPIPKLDFDIGLVPGVFAGALLSSVAAGTFRIQGFEAGVTLPRYLTGACLMGFGGMLAGGCAVGAGVTGGSVFALTAIVALFFMWLSAGLTDLLVDRDVLFGRNVRIDGHSSPKTSVLSAVDTNPVTTTRASAAQ